jgi:type II secretory pathway component PulM
MTALARAWDRASPRERTLLRWGAFLVGLAILYAAAWQPLTRDIERTREALARDRATLATLRSYADVRASGSVEPAPADVRAAVERVLDARGLRAAATLEAREGRVGAVLGSVAFDTLVRVLDDLARAERVRLIEARITARVEPATVRAELTLGR